jgi:transmembrane sensor
MSDELSPIDPDREWAVRIGQALEDAADGPASLESLDAGDDATMQALLAYRHVVRAERATPPAETSERIWAGIEAEMDAAEQTAADAPVEAPSPRERREERAPRRSGSRRSGRTVPTAAWRMAVAAVVLVAAGMATWWITSAPSAPLVAEAQTAVATHTTADGSTVRLRPNSRLYRVSSEGDAAGETARYRLEGEAVFAVTSRPDRTFEVEAGGAVVRVLGTRFTVRTWTPHPEVFLDEGRVELRSDRGGSPVVLQPGQRGVVQAGGIDVGSARAETYSGWLEGTIAVDGRPAGSVAAELSYHYDVSIQLPDSVAAQTLSGRLRLTDRSSTLRSFAIALGGRFIEAGEDRFVFRTNEE